MAEFVLQLNHRPCSTYMENLQRDITQSMRGILIDWLVEVCAISFALLFLVSYMLDVVHQDIGQYMLSTYNHTPA